MFADPTAGLELDTLPAMQMPRLVDRLRASMRGHGRVGAVPILGHVGL